MTRGKAALMVAFVAILSTSSAFAATQRTLVRGMKGADVAVLQQFLITQKLLTADSATGFYGAVTESAVKQFQCQNLSVCKGTPASNGYGAVGPKTRAKIATMSSSQTYAQSVYGGGYSQSSYGSSYSQGTYVTTPPPPPPSSAPPPPSPTPPPPSSVPPPSSPQPSPPPSPSTQQYTTCGALNTQTANRETGNNYIIPFAYLGGDTNQNGNQSPVMIFENGLTLGPAHSIHQTIRDSGAGRFSHWYDTLYFSSSDNSNPASNGKTYTWGVATGTNCPGAISAAYDASGITDLSSWSAYSPPTISIPRRAVEVRISGTTYIGMYNGTTMYSGGNFMNDVLQPSIDYLASQGGGTVHLNAGTYHLVGPSSRRASSGQNLEIELKNNVAVIGDANGSADPLTVISMDSTLGNVFSGRYASNIVVANLTIQGNHLGNYDISNYAVRNALIRNVRIYYPAQTGFGHNGGLNNWYVDDQVFSDNDPDGGHGFAVGGNQLAIDPNSMQDNGTTIVNAFSAGYGNVSRGGEAVDIRCATNPGSDGAQKNINFRIIGGKFAASRVGIYVCDAPDILIQNPVYDGNAQDLYTTQTAASDRYANLASVLAALESALESLIVR